jgi:putative thioredoxin
MPSADPYLGLASCQTALGETVAARRTLELALQVEPGNPVVEANIGLLESRAGRHAAAVSWLKQALATDPDFHEARFNLALAYARAGLRAEAAAAARELLERLPADAPQRAEVLRLLEAVSAGGE